MELGGDELLHRTWIENLTGKRRGVHRRLGANQFRRINVIDRSTYQQLRGW